MLERSWEDLTGQVVQGRYTLRSLASAGSCQAEFVAYAGPPPEQGEPLSVTLIIPDEADSERQLAQIATARRSTHPNLPCIVDGGECAFEGTTLLFVVTEATGATLAASIAEAPFGLKEATALTEDLLAGLDYIHRQGFVYRNLEPDTVVRAGAHWKLADLSQLHRAGPLEGGATGGPNAPPEASLGSVEPGWDVWALGATLRAALTEEVRRGPLFGAIIAGCLEANPAKRLSLGEIRRFLDKGEINPRHCGAQGGAGRRKDGATPPPLPCSGCGNNTRRSHFGSGAGSGGAPEGATGRTRQSNASRVARPRRIPFGGAAQPVHQQSRNRGEAQSCAATTNPGPQHEPALDHTARDHSRIRNPIDQPGRGGRERWPSQLLCRQSERQTHGEWRGFQQCGYDCRASVLTLWHSPAHNQPGER